MDNSIKDNYVHFAQLLSQEEKEIIFVTCPWCYRETPFDLLSIENYCKHCSININHELLDIIQEGDS